MAIAPLSLRALGYLVFVAVLTLATLLYTLSWARAGHTSPLQVWPWDTPHPNFESHSNNSTSHPISHPISQAETIFYSLKYQHPASLTAAASAYRTAHGRHPPPSFDKWHAYATHLNATISEAFFSQIYRDLAPFWSIPPRTLRAQAASFSNRLTIRNGNVTASSFNVHPKLTGWLDLFTTLAREVADVGALLPDIDVPLNVNDEPAMLVPWADIDTALSLARPFLPPPRDVVTSFSAHEDVGDLHFDPDWRGPRRTHPDSWLGPLPLWALVRPACPPHSPAQKTKVWNDIWTPHGESAEEHSPVSLLEEWEQEVGYVGNWTEAVGVCRSPHLQGLHAAFVAPVNMAVATKLFPLFGGSFGVGNEITMPGAAEWSAVTRAVDVVSWEEKADVLFWRGNATKGFNEERYWRRFQRERFVSMVNGSQVRMAEESMRGGHGGVGVAGNFILPSMNPYNLTSLEDGTLGDWVESWADVAFTDVPSFMDPYFSARTASSTTEGTEAKARFAISLDGNGADDTGFFVQELKNGKVVLRATVFRRWFDARLIPWVHFVPLDNTLVDIYSVMEYLLGHSRSADEGKMAARRIAESGQQWANRVLRREDMLVYVYRLVLEYARVLDDRRDRIGWVADMLEQT